MKPVIIKRYECIAFIAFILLCSSCTKPFVSVTPPPSQWNVMLQMDASIPEPVQQEIGAAYDNFIQYSAGRPVQYVNVDTEFEANMVIRIRAYEGVTPGQNAAGVLVTMLGFATPVIMAAAGVPFVVTFWYFPKTQSVAEMRVRGSDGSSAAQMIRVLGPGFLKKPERQVELHGKQYDNFFIRLSRFHEKEYSKWMRKAASQSSVATK